MEGRTKRKLRKMLEANGFHEVRLWEATGYWRTDSRADVYRWEGQAVSNGLHVSLCSWNTMTACVQSGIEIKRDDVASFEISAKEAS
jgi:hypothetical protein